MIGLVCRECLCLVHQGWERCKYWFSSGTHLILFIFWSLSGYWLELVTCSSVLVTIRESGAPYSTRELSSRSEYNIKDPYFHSSYQAMKNTRFRPRRLTQLLRKVNIRLPFNQLSVFKSHFVYFFFHLNHPHPFTLFSLLIIWDSG